LLQKLRLLPSGKVAFKSTSTAAAKAAAHAPCAKVGSTSTSAVKVFSPAPSAQVVSKSNINVSSSTVQASKCMPTKSTATSACSF
jgi:hypothetical protein